MPRGIGASEASPRPAHTGMARPSRPQPTGVIPAERIPPEGCTRAGAESTPPARTRRKLSVRCVPITPGPSVTLAVRPASAAPTGLNAWELKSLAPANFRVPRRGAGGLLRSRDTRRVAGYVRIQAGRITFGHQTPECGAPERASRLSPRTGERHRRSPGNRSRRFRRCGSWIWFVDVGGHDDGSTGPGRRSPSDEPYEPVAASAGPPVSSHNEWDPWEEVVAGRLDGAVFSSRHPVVACNVPRWAAHLQGLAAGRRYPRILVESAQHELDRFIACCAPWRSP